MMAARAKHPNSAVEISFTDLEVHRGFKITSDKTGFTVTCKAGTMSKHIPLRNAGQILKDFVRDHGKAHPHE